LVFRGPGYFFGPGLWGLRFFGVPKFFGDAVVRAAAWEDAFALVRDDPHLARPEHQELKRTLEMRWNGRLKLVRVG
jgi:hypothetical protein